MISGEVIFLTEKLCVFQISIVQFNIIGNFLSLNFTVIKDTNEVFRLKQRSNLIKFLNNL